jgi:hypothetical protein
MEQRRSTSTIGERAEAAVLAALVRAGKSVCLPSPANATGAALRSSMWVRTG